MFLNKTVSKHNDMSSKYVYLLVDFLTFIFPFMFSFFPKADFSKQWKHLWLAILIPGTIFIVWDEVFTRQGVWGFNENYLSGIYIGTLPLEEIFFFICITYACVFTYESLTQLIKRDFFSGIEKSISVAIVTIAVLVALFNYQKAYTFWTLIVLGLSILVLRFHFKKELGRFYFAFVLLLFPFLVVNGILTGSWIDQPVVWYNDEENLGIRIGTIPIEDLFYAMLLMLMNVSIFEMLKARRNKAVHYSAMSN